MFDSLCLSSGGVKGVTQLGALYKYYLQEKLGSVKKYYGCSAGSIICLLLCCGYTPQEIFIDLCELNIAVNSNDFNSIFDSCFGIVNPKRFKRILKGMVIKKLGYVPSLLGLKHERGCKLYIYTTDITTGKLKVLSSKTSPFESCVNAVVMSCTIPFVFRRCSYVDGALISPIPNVNKENTLYIITVEDLQCKEVYTATEYILRIFEIVHSLSVKIPKERKGSEILKLSSGSVQSLKRKDIIPLFISGFKQAQEIESYKLNNVKGVNVRGYRNKYAKCTLRKRFKTRD